MIIKSRYRLLEQIGNGGMAEVFKAHDELLDRAVAIKILRGQFCGDQDFVRRFKREAQAAARLSHPNIVNIYDVGEENSRHYIVMEYVDGMTLKDWIDLYGPLDWKEAVRVAREVADALGHAHQLGLVHCDIKPHNILIGKNGRIKVTDFGIARAISSATMTMGGNIFGSIHYFSPEQARGKLMDGKSDLYSLGILLYEMLTGKVPFEADTPIATALLHLQEEVPHLPADAGLPGGLDVIIQRATQKNPQDRYGTADEMICDLMTLDTGVAWPTSGGSAPDVTDHFATKILPKLGDDLPLPDKGKPSAGQQPMVLEGDADVWWRNRRLMSIIAVIMAAGFLLGAFLAYGKFWSTNEIKVPDVTGKSIEVARAILSEQNLRVTITESYHPKVPAGHIISQNPEAGALVKEQRQITLVISKGTELVVVPDVKGLKQRDAEIALQNAGLRIGKVEEQVAPDVPPGTVITQNPRSPAQMSKGDVVDLVVSKASGGKIAVPDVRGMSSAAAAKALEDRKLKLGSVTEVSGERAATGSVVSQSPLPTIEVVEGTVVNITIAKGSASASKQVSVNFTVPQGASRQNVQVYLTDSAGRKLVYESSMRPGDKLERSFEASGSGPVRVQVYVNGALAQESSQ